MKITVKYITKYIGFFLLFWIILPAIVFCQTTVTYTNNGTFTVPAGVYSLDIECWGGGGGGGGQNLASDGGGGGGGGAYSKKINYSVNPGDNIPYFVGSAGTGGTGAVGTTGGDTYFNNSTTVLAKGGSPGSNSTGTPPAGGLGGAAASGVGDVKFSGGNGGKGRDNATGQGGPGGSSAGTAANGTNGPDPWSTVTAAAAPAGGGIGGNGGTANNPGNAPASGYGGGGGGSGEGSPQTGGNGTGGKITITYCERPTTQANNITFASVTATQMDVSWTNGNGSNRIVVAKAGSAITGTPVYGTTYAANSVFGSGDIIAANEYVVYNGAGSTVTVTGLTGGTTYYFQVFEYNCSSFFTNYYTVTAANNPNSQATSALATCYDNIKNQDETGIDCGGATCPPCNCE